MSTALPAGENGESQKLGSKIVDVDEPVASTSNVADRIPEPAKSRTHIQADSVLLLQLPSESIRIVNLVEHNIINLGRYGSFLKSELVGHPFGVTLEILPKGEHESTQEDSDAVEAAIKQNKQGRHRNGKGKQKDVGPKVKDLCKLKRMESTFLAEEITLTDATNEQIAATGVKTLSGAEILRMKQEGISGKEIIERQIAEHEGYELKNEFSKAKYRKTKESKYLKYLVALSPTIHNVSQYFFDEDPNKIRDLRPDTLAQMLSLANIRPGARVLIVDDSAGMLTSAVAERMAGEGAILLMHPNDSPPVNHVAHMLNMPTSFTDKQMLREMHWGLTDDDWVSFDLPIEPEGGEIKSERERNRLKRRKHMQQYLADTIQCWKNGEFDALIMSSHFDPISVIEKVLPILAGSAQIVIHSPTIEVLSTTLRSLLTNTSVLNPTIVEPFLRQYQVLPGRTHPEMNGIGHGGFILHSIRVIDDGTVVRSARTDTRKKQRRR